MRAAMFIALFLISHSIAWPAESQARLQSLRQWTTRTIFPEISLTKLSFREALHAVQQATTQHSPDHRTFSAILHGEDTHHSTINLHLKQANLEKVLDELCRQNDMQWQLETYGIVFTPSLKPASVPPQKAK